MRPLVILSLLAACGGHGNVASDAPVAADAAAPDAAAPDASGPDAATGPAVSITIQRNTVPVSGVHVIFTDASSSIVADVFTDATGTASHVMAAGGSVTAIDPFPLIAQVVGASNLYTIAGVKPGDHLRLTQHATAPDGISFALLTAGIANATYYDFNTDCVEGAFGASATGTAYFRKPCTSSDLYIVAFDAGSNVVGTLFHPDLAATQGATIDLTGEPYLPAVTRSYTYANLPSSSVSTSYHLFSAKNVLFNGFVTGPAAGGAATLSLAQPAIDGHLAVVDSTMSVGTTFNDVIDWGTDGGDYTLDPTGLLLPAFSTPPAFDRSSGTLSWTPGATGAAPDVVIATLAAGKDDYLQWQLVAPYTGGAVAYPQIAGYQLAADDTIGVTVQTVKVPGGYDAVRPIVFDHQYLGGSWFAADGASGRVVVATTNVAAM